MIVSEEDLTQEAAPTTKVSADDLSPSKTGEPVKISEDDISDKPPGFFENIINMAAQAKAKVQAAFSQQQQQTAAAQQAQAQKDADPQYWTADQFKERTPKPQTPDAQAEYDNTLKQKEDQEETFKQTYFQNKYGFDPQKQHDEFKSLMAPDMKIEAMKPQSFFDKISTAVENLYSSPTGLSPVGVGLKTGANLTGSDTGQSEAKINDAARKGNIVNLAQYTGLDANTVSKNYDSITQELGLRDYPNAAEVISAGMLLGLPASVEALGPVAVAKGLAQYTAAKEGTERVLLPAAKAVWEKLNGDPVKYDVTKLTDFFPDDSKDIGTVSEFLLYGMGAKGIDDLLQTEPALKAGNRFMGELNGLRGKILQAFGVDIPTGLEPITYEAAQKAFPDNWKDIVSQKEWNRYKSDLSEKVTEQNRQAEETRQSMETKPPEAATPVTAIVVSEADLSPTPQEAPKMPFGKSLYDFKDSEKEAMGEVVNDIQNMEAKKRLPVENNTGGTDTIVSGYVPEYLSNKGVTKANDLPILNKAISGEPLTEKQAARANELVGHWADEMTKRYGVSYEDLMNPKPFNLDEDNAKLAQQKLEEANADAEREAGLIEGFTSELTESEKRIAVSGAKSDEQGLFEEAKKQVLADASTGSVPQTNSLPNPPDLRRKLTAFDTPEVIDARQIHDETPNTSLIDTPERQGLRQEIADKILKQTKNPVAGKRLDVVMGLPASGKSKIFIRPIQKTYHSIVLDSDDVKNYLPEFNGHNAGAVHKESSDVLEKYLIPAAVSHGLNIALPILGKNFSSVQSLLKPFRDAGYSIHLRYSEIPPEQSAQRAVSRFLEGETLPDGRKIHRFVDPQYILNEVGLKPNDTYAKLKAEGVDTYERYSNDVPKGSPPVLLEKGPTKSVQPGGSDALRGGQSGGEGESRKGEGQESLRPSPVLQSAVIPGAKEFYEQDVEPFLKGAATGVQETAKLLQNILVPTAGVGNQALDEIMRMKGTRDELYYKLDAQTKDIENFFNRMKNSEKIAFIDRIKRGEEQPTQNLRAIATMIESIDAAQWQYAKRWAPSLGWLENHYRVLWKVIPGTVPDEQNFLGVFKRPLQGSKGFLKHSTLDDMSTGIAAGGVPYTYNPMTMFKKAYADMNKFITAQKMWARMKEMGMVKFVKNSQPAPLNMVALDDAIARAYFMQNEDTFIPPQELNPEASYRAEEGPAAIQPPGLKEAGRYYMDEGPGRLLNNYLSKDNLRATAFGRGLLWLKNNSTAVELSLSPFHAVFESLESMGSGVGLGFSKLYNVGLLKQNPQAALDALKDIVTAPASPYLTAKLGGKAIKLMSKEDFLGSEAGKYFIKKYPEVKELLSDLFMGGGRLAIAEDYQLNSIQAFQESLTSGNYIGASLRALPALNQVTFHPLFEVYIPRLKVGHFLREYPNNLQIYEKELAAGKMTRLQVARMTWRSVENRFGEMNFDNLFWNNNFKTAMQMMMRSVTWKVGSLSEYGTAAAGQAKEFYDAARERRAPRLHPSMAWLFGVTAMTVALAEILQRTLSGKNISNQKDALFPQVDKEGSRVSMPTYWRDIFHLMHNPLGYMKSGLSGEIGRIADIWNNKDFYGQEIYNFSDPLYTKMWKSAAHIVPLPFSISSYQSFKKAGITGPPAALGFAGFTRAPGYINQTPLQENIFKLYQQRFGSSGSVPKKEFESQQARSQIKQVIQLSQKARAAGDSDTAQKKMQEAQQLIRDAVKNGQLTARGLGAFQANAKLPPDVRAFKRLPQSDQVSLMEKMKPDELATYKKYASKSSIREYVQNQREKVSNAT